MRKKAWLLLGVMTLHTTFAFAEIAGAGADKGRVLHLDGSVQVREPGESAWKTPKKGTWLKAGTEIKTGAGSSCDIGLGEGRSSVLQMKENSQTRLQILTPSAIQVDLANGRIFARVRDLKKDSTFKVSAPTAIASVRGTGWEQSTDEVNVFEDSVEVAGSGGESMLVEEGFGVDIGTGGDIEAPEPVDPEDRAEYENFEAQAEQLVAEEPTLPEDPGYEESSGTEESSATEAESESESTENETGDFDSFSEGFGSEGFEEPGDSGTGEDVLGEAKEEQQESDTEDDSGEDEDEDCVPNISNNYTC